MCARPFSHEGAPKQDSSRAGPNAAPVPLLLRSHPAQVRALPRPFVFRRAPARVRSLPVSPLPIARILLPVTFQPRGALRCGSTLRRAEPVAESDPRRRTRTEHQPGHPGCAPGSECQNGRSQGSRTVCFTWRAPTPWAVDVVPVTNPGWNVHCTYTPQSIRERRRVHEHGPRSTRKTCPVDTNSDALGEVTWGPGAGSRAKEYRHPIG